MGARSLQWGGQTSAWHMVVETDVRTTVVSKQRSGPPTCAKRMVAEGDASTKVAVTSQQRAPWTVAKRTVGANAVMLRDVFVPLAEVPRIVLPTVVENVALLQAATKLLKVQPHVVLLMAGGGDAS
mmetsp:Transcript_1167/g.1857  ORF Transcript_1167/g.1857 Transcript_1167/m.1857 type:complete len:126 (+) Transcript_1167:1482-1859(+)